MQPAQNGSRALRWGLLILALALGAMAAFQFAGRGSFDDMFGGSLRKARLAGQMRAALYAAAEAEKGAVLAETDEDSKNYADRARQELGRVAAALAECQDLTPSTGPESGLVAAFAGAFADYRAQSEEILAQAVQNTNLKAQALSFNESRQALERMERALAPLADAPAGQRIAPHAALALRALLEAQRIQSLHAQHIEEKDDARMDALEARMAEADKRARAALAALSGQPGATLSAGEALAAYEDFHKTTARITELSRQNTNVHSLALTLGRGTRLLAACDASLKAYEEKLQADMAKGTR